MKRSNIIGRIPTTEIKKDMRHIERTEGMKFKQTPKVLVVARNNRVGHNVVERERQGSRVKPINSTIFITDSTNRSNLAQKVLRHELREVLYYQHGVDLKQNVHNKAQRHWGRD